MKKTAVCTLLFLLLIHGFAFAQIPAEGINYQAIARDTSGRPLANMNVDLIFTIYNDSSGVISTPFAESHNSVSTNIYGLFTAVIGSIDSLEFKTINWTRGKKSLKVEIAVAGSGSFVSMGTNSLVSVPYALYSKNTGNAWRLNGNNATNTDFIGTTNPTALTFKTNNTERIKILSNGNTGIGTSLPNAQLDIKSNGNTILTYGLGVRNNQDIYTLAVRDDGYVGVGTTLPNARLDIKGKSDNSSTYSFGVADSAGSYTLAIRDDRKVGIGTYTPLSLLSVGASSGFQVNDSGTVVAATGITSSGSVNFSALSTDGIVRATGSTGTLSTSGGNINLASEVTGVLPVTNGGTGLSSFANWQTFYSDGTGTLTQLPLGAAGTTLQSNGTSTAPSWAYPLSSTVMQPLTQGSGVSPFSYDGSALTTISLDSTGVAASTYSGGLSGQILTIPNFTVNEQGRLTSATTTAFTLSSSTPVIFKNGLTQIADTAYWGGELTQHTDIATKNFNIAYRLEDAGHFTINTNGNTTAFFVKPTNGNIGIGTNTPLGKLQVNYDTTVNFATGPGLNAYGTIHLVPDKNIASNSTGITFGSPDEFISEPRKTVQAGIYVQGSGSYGTKMYFATTNDFNISGAKTRMMIDHQGQVGIGTTSPGYTLDVQAATGTLQVLSTTVGKIATIRATNDAGNAKFVVESSTGGTSYTGSTPYSAIMGTDYFRSLHLATNSIVRATILPTGEFGIGTVTPASKLDVEGGVSIGSAYSGTTAAPANGAIIQGKVGIGTTSPLTSLEINGAITLTSDSVNLINGSVITPGNRGYIRMTSSADITAGNIASGLKKGQTLILENANPAGGYKIKIDDGSGVQISGPPTFQMNPSATLTLIWNGTDWLETSRGDN